MATPQDLFSKGRDILEDDSTPGNTTLLTKAASYFRQAIDVAKPNEYPDAASMLSTCLLMLQDTKQAKFWANEALKLIPHSLRSRSAIALCLWIESESKLGQSNFLQRMNDGSFTGLAFGLVGVGVQASKDSSIRGEIDKAFLVWGETLKYCVYNQTEEAHALIDHIEFMLELPPSSYVNRLLSAITSADWTRCKATPQESEKIEDLVHRASGQLSLSK